MPQTPKTPGQPSKPSQASMNPRDTQKQPRTDQQGSGLRGAGRDTPPRKDDK